ncbi:Transcription factor Ovo-like 2 [Mizuhopecten yessoensis]|uniref:Transcription factor Ovo-like 2 n=1 Tax=Mizuhopecten yessoensis TaxID=6573 RepID=A0A210Q3I6_MIZYE|nr:Transcription factor Ovo-like 2 [Mizuhopecten yessoensis]
MASSSQNDQNWLKSYEGGLNPCVKGGLVYQSPIIDSLVSATPVDNRLTHFSSEDASNVVAKCDVCGKSFRSMRGFELHRKMHMYAEGCINGPQCRICGKHFQTKAHLRRHMKSHSSEKPHVCSVCNKAYKHRKDLALHTKQTHM